LLTLLFFIITKKKEKEKETVLKDVAKLAQKQFHPSLYFFQQFLQLLSACCYNIAYGDFRL
jgi:hypothetical protein